MVVGYDKDNDVYTNYGVFDRVDEAIHHTNVLTLLMSENKLTILCGEPIDWIEIYKNFDKDEEEKILSSYE